ncbi:MAG TPA: ABC transporter ATP-binding protein [Chloroflexi bacterium]|nr:ABC transporter ATP-binding protein [Chloroflexota bacterium]
MYAVENDIALNVAGVTKKFVKSEGFPWPWKRRRNGDQNGRQNGNGRRTVVAVDGVEFQVHRGEVFGILGPNGSGKSTLVRCLSTLLLPDEGSIAVFGHDVLQEEMVVKRLINRVSVDASFFKKLTPMENLLYGARLYGLGAREAKRRALEILERLGLEREPIFQPMEEMSRGMQQKVAIARAFLTQPIVLLLDEPTTGLDPRSKREVQAFVEELRDTHDATILLTTHDMQEADALCDRIAILDDGKIVALDTPAGLKSLVPSINGHEPTLEDVFMELTGKQLVKDEDEKSE